MLGYEWNEAKTKHMLDFVDTEDHELMARRRSAIDQHEVLPPVEVRCLKRDGSIVIGDAHGFPTTIDGQNARIVVIRDVTARKKVEDDLERLVEERTRELQESEARFRDFINRSPDVVWRVNREEVVTFVSI